MSFQKYSVLTVSSTAENLNKNLFHRTQDCFNCEGDHTLRDCPYPKDFNKISQKRREMKMKTVYVLNEIYNAEVLVALAFPLTPGK